MNPDAGRAAAAWLSPRLPKMEEALAALVEQNSYTENVEGGRLVGERLVELFSVSGLSAQAIVSQRFAPHRVFSSVGNGQAPVALLGHLDTVFPPGKFEGYRVDGPLRRGPGVLDMKGGLVVVAFALQAVEATVGLSAVRPLRVVVVSDEEQGSPEGQGVIARAVAGADRCLVFESGRPNDAIITRRKGTGALLVEARGKSAHAGNAHADGANALWALARFVDRAQALTDYARGVTVNVGRLSGGQSKNTVPDQGEAQVDVRFVARADADALLARLEAAAGEAAASVPGTSLSVRRTSLRLPLERTEASAQLLSDYAACARAEGLGGGESPLVGGGSDASTTAALGIASIDGLGPRGAGFHTADEHLEVATLVPRAAALARFLVGAG